MKDCELVPDRGVAQQAHEANRLIEIRFEGSFVFAAFRFRFGSLRNRQAAYETSVRWRKYEHKIHG